MNKRIIALYLLIVASCGMALAQSYTTVSYSMSVPAGSISDFISQPSFRGIAIDYRSLVYANLGVGFSAGWNVFYEALDYDTYTIDNVSVSGKQYRYSNHVPLLAAADYFLQPGEAFNPFVGIGIGTMYSRRNTDMNLYTYELDAWNFALQPQVGFNYTLNNRSALTVMARYYQGFAAGQIEGDQSFFSLNVGFTFMR